MAKPNCFMRLAITGETNDLPEFELAKATEAEAKGDFAGAIAVLDKALQRQTNSPVLWNAKGQYLTKSARTNEAIEAFSRAIEIAGNDTKSFKADLNKAFRHRAALYRQMGRLTEAAADNCRALGIPPGDPRTKPKAIDLSAFYVHDIINHLQLNKNGNELRNIGEVVRQNTGIDFDLRGLFWLSGTVVTQYNFPASVSGIAVNRRFDRLHILHAAGAGDADGTKIGVYVVHYADGQSAEIPIVYGRNTRAMWWWRDNLPTPDAVIAWTGIRTEPQFTGPARIYKTAWDNPRPEVEVLSIDVISMMSKANPGLFALTVEELKPGTPAYWLKKAGDSLKRGDFNSALATLEAAEKEVPKHPPLWELRGELFERFHRTNEALQAFSQAIKMAESNTNEFAKVLNTALLRRVGLWRDLGRLAEAGVDNCRLLDVPLRNPKISSNLIDLSVFYNVAAPWRRATGAERTVSEEVVLTAGVQFDARALIRLRGADMGSDGQLAFPRSITNLEVNTQCEQLHFLHGTPSADNPGVMAGTYLLRYADNKCITVPIVYGEDFLAYEAAGSLRPRSLAMRILGPEIIDAAVDIHAAVRAARSEVAWIDNDRAGRMMRLYKLSFPNPRSGQKLKSIDLVSAMNRSAPVLVAISVETVKDGTPESWRNKAQELADRGEFDGAASSLEIALKTYPSSPLLWNVKGELLVHSRRTNEALQAFGKAIGLAGANSNEFTNELKRALIKRTALFRALGRMTEAGADNCRAWEAPTRNPATKPNLIDLSAFYTASLGRYWPSMDSKAMRELLEGLRRNTGVDFDVRGLVGLYGKSAPGPLPTTVSGIPINLRLSQLHLLHTSGFKEQEGVQVGAYIVHYADGKVQAVPIIYGEDIRLDRGDKRPTAHATIAWKDSDPLNPRSAQPVLYRTIWKNPRPEVLITQLDFVSALSESSPRLFGITAE